jgi:hypothetical protein
MERITPEEFMNIEEINSRAIKCEWIKSIDPKFRKYKCNLLSFLSQEVFPTYRLDTSKTKLTSVYEDKKATPITFSELIKHPNLYQTLIREGFKNTSTNILAYHCSKCNVFVIKDGIHRLIKWSIEQDDKELIIYQVESDDWSNANIDMPNYCKCK